MPRPLGNPQFGNTGASELLPRIGQRVQPIRRMSRAAHTTHQTSEMAGHRGYGDSNTVRPPRGGCHHLPGPIPEMPSPLGNPRFGDARNNRNRTDDRREGMSPRVKKPAVLLGATTGGTSSLQLHIESTLVLQHTRNCTASVKFAVYICICPMVAYIGEQRLYQTERQPKILCG